MTKQILEQYTDLQEEVKEIQEKIDRLEREIPRIEKRIKEIEKGEVVKDKVRGGLGGLQSYYIEGIPIKEYEDDKTKLMMKKVLLAQRKSTLEILEFDLLKTTNEVEEFIAGISDSFMRRIVNLRILEKKSWKSIAEYMGGNNTEDTVRKAFSRFVEEK